MTFLSGTPIGFDTDRYVDIDLINVSGFVSRFWVQVHEIGYMR